MPPIGNFKLTFHVLESKVQHLCLVEHGIDNNVGVGIFININTLAFGRFLSLRGHVEHHLDEIHRSIDQTKRYDNIFIGLANAKLHRKLLLTLT